MKSTRTLQIVATLILGLGQVTGHSQTYFYSGPVSGYTEVDLSPNGYGSGGFNTFFGTLTETLYYDPVAQTLQEVGSVTVNPASGSFNIVGSSFVYPYTGEYGSATVTVGNNGSFSFDHTTSDVTPGGSGEGGSSQALELHVPVSGSGIYNGQAFAGSWNIDLPVFARISALSPTSLTFSEFKAPLPFGFHGVPVVPGTDLYDAISDGTYYWSWELDSAVATAVPEPNSLSLLGLGLSALAFLRRRATRAWARGFSSRNRTSTASWRS